MFLNSYPAVANALQESVRKNAVINLRPIFDMREYIKVAYFIKLTDRNY